MWLQGTAAHQYESGLLEVAGERLCGDAGSELVGVAVGTATLIKG
jgi:hypothetical protein